MKKSFFILFVLSFFFSCSDDDYSGYSYNEDTIYSGGNNKEFTEIIGFISPYIMDGDTKKYLVAENLRNVEVSLNNRSWKADSTYSLDVEKIVSKELLGDYWVTSEKMTYPVIINITIKPDDLTTAGEYANLINNYYSLPPGTYVCHISSFDIKTRAEELKTIYMHSAFTPLEVKEGQVSANAGEFEVRIY